MNQQVKDPRKTPILSVIVEHPQSHSYGAIASIKVGFRYWSERNCLEYYGDYDYRFTKFALGYFYLKHVVSGDRPQDGDEDQYCPCIQYENLYSLRCEDHVKAMSRTLLYFKSKLKPLQCEEGR